jgi:hypothetical protein
MSAHPFSEPVTLFSVYAKADELFCHQIETHLSMLRQQGFLASWQEEQILAGQERAREIDEHLDTAAIILLLISPDFLASDYCYNSMQRALDRQHHSKVHVIPIILRPVDRENAPFGRLQCLPRDGKSVSEWDNQDAAFADIARHLRQIIERQNHSLLSARIYLPHPIVQQNRSRLLQRLRTWYGDLMSVSLQKAAWMELGLAEKPDAIHHLASLLLQTAQFSERILPPGTSIVQVYEQSHQKLLILGVPGAGKSTLLYHLALHLVEQAEQNSADSLPIIFPLSTWAVKPRPLEQWMSEQLTQIYKVPKNLSSHWIQSEQIIPLLDGLDEMDKEARPLCIQAINTYHRDYAHALVVCSRSAEYTTAAIPERLTLQNAVVVQPLEIAQVETTLLQGGKALAALRAAYKKNVALRDLATTPLMLNLLILTYQGVGVSDLPTKGDELQRQLLTRYVQRMIKPRGDTSLYPQQQTYSWLHWLAEQMRSQQQTVFILEQLQPDWLPQQVRSLYNRSIRVIGGLLFGLCGGLIGGLAGWLIGWLSGGLIGGLIGGVLFTLVGGQLYGQGGIIKLAERLDWLLKEARKGLVAGLLVGSIGGVIGGLIFGLMGGIIGGLIGGLIVGFSIFQLNDRLYLSSYEGYRRSIRNGLIIGLVGGPLVGLLVGLIEGLTLGLVSGLIFGLIGGLIGGVVGGLFVGFSTSQLSGRFHQGKYRRSMRNRLLGGLVVGLLVGLASELLEWLIFRLIGGPIGGLIGGLVGGLVGGLAGGLVGGFSTSPQLSGRSRFLPHEGYRRSMRHGLTGGLFIGLLIGLVAGLVGGLNFGLVGGLIFGLIGGLVGGVLFGMVFGLGAIIQYNTLRFWLQQSDLFPWRAVDFLKDVQTRYLLVRVGGGYQFAHRLLLDYFANLKRDVLGDPVLDDF